MYVFALQRKANRNPQNSLLVQPDIPHNLYLHVSVSTLFSREKALVIHNSICECVVRFVTALNFSAVYLVYHCKLPSTL